MNFGEAIERLKNGERLYRDGWNGKDQYIFLVPESVDHRYRPFVMMKTVQDDYVPWLASQTDVLADDWETLSGPLQAADHQPGDKDSSPEDPV